MEGRTGSSTLLKGTCNPISIQYGALCEGKGGKPIPSTDRVHAAGLGTSGLLWVWEGS